MGAPKGSITISIDLELAWGNWDNLSAYHVRNIQDHERIIASRLIEIFDRYEVPVTWAFVAALMDEKSARNMPGDENLWYAPDVIEKICKAKVQHDFGSHGGRHRYFDAMSEQEATEDLQYAAHIHKVNDLSWKSFIYPRNKVAYTHLLAREGLRIFRGQDKAWHQKIRNQQVTLGRLANLVDKMLPFTPETVNPIHVDGIYNLPGSILLLSRDGLRRLAHPRVMTTKLEKGIEAAVQSKSVLHLWFHPSNFWSNTDQQFFIFEDFLAKATKQIEKGTLEFRTMAGSC